jgi:ureidoacrylate peracid hydrolase
MKEVEGRRILTTLDEKVDPQHCAVLVIDMQKDFTTAGLSMTERGRDVSDVPELALRLIRFLDVARRRGVFVVHIMANYDPQFLNDPMYERMLRLRFGHYCLPGTRGIEFHEGLAPRPGEPVIVKHRFDAFYETELHLLLQARGVKTVVLTGVAVHGCVYATAAHAYFHGYYVVFPTDLTGLGSPADRQAAYDSIERAYGVTPTAAAISEAWGS